MYSIAHLLVQRVVFVLFHVLFDLLETALVFADVLSQTKHVQLLPAKLVFQLGLLDPRVDVTTK